MRKTQQIIDSLRAGASVVSDQLYGDTMKEAADIIEALVADLKKSNAGSLCDVCAHSRDNMPCADSDFMCEDCPYDCMCKNCRGDSEFEWRGVQNEKQHKGE